MIISIKNQRKIFLWVNVGVIAALLLFPLYLKIIPYIPTMSKCDMVEALHIYCPGCGATRALKALLRFDIISSFKLNPIVPVSAALFVIYDIAMAVSLIIGKERKLFIKTIYLIILFSAWMIYAVVRNILLVNGIDLLGDIL